MKTRTSLLLTGICLLAVGCVEPGETLSDEDLVSDPGSLDAERRREALDPPVHQPTVSPAAAHRVAGWGKCALYLDALPTKAGTGSFGDIAFGPRCSILVAGGLENVVYRFDSKVEKLSVFAKDFPDSDRVVAVAPHPPTRGTLLPPSHGGGRGRVF